MSQPVPHGPYRHLEIVRGGGPLPPVVAVGLPDVLSVVKGEFPPEVPVWWLRTDGFAAPPFLIRPFPEIAASFADEIDRYMPTGPLVLIGFSFSALIAVELAHRLGRDDVEVLLLEPPLPGILPARAKLRRTAAARPATPKAADRAEAAVPRERARGPIAGAVRAACVDLWCRGYLLLQESLLRPYLESRARRGKPIPARFRSWWFYLPQVHDRTMKYRLPPYAGRIHLAGRSDWLSTYLPSWKVLAEPGEVISCPLSQAADHAAINRLPSARPWVELIGDWLAASSRDVPGPIA
ncbi:thioesterase domain-containing protein [Aquisphaera insulae]|uniref:thioesterase domain-containing protein n=1 Tax=Aquisphaera insulae TaxID=2712864 RepID=UPI0013EB3A38|nr:thioesterase domain-containing protein [Aquisphaera insulae]